MAQRYFRILPTLPLLTAVALLVAAPAFVGSSSAAPVVGFRETWPGTTVSNWGGGSGASNPGTGGSFGAGDGYLVVSDLASPVGTFLGTRSNGLEYIGDWIAAGVTEVRFWLDDVNAANPLEIHFGIGNGSNFWQLNQGFIPPHGAWAPFTASLTDSTAFTHIVALDGKGFAAALHNTDRLLFRHDVAPFPQEPDTIRGDFGVDNLLLTNGSVGVPPMTTGTVRTVELAAPYPNPSRGNVALALQTPDADAVRIEIVDVSGRLVRRAELPAGAAGPRLWIWDGRDDGGRTVAPGHYRARAFGDHGGTSRPLVRMQ